MKADPLSAAVERKRDWTGTCGQGAVAERRDYLRALSPEKITRMSDYVREARAGRKAVGHELAFPVEPMLEMISGVESTSNPLDLLLLAEVPGDDCVAVQQRFEAVCVLDLAAMTLELERRDPMDAVEYDQRAMIALFEEHVFAGRPYDLDIYTYHNSADAYRAAVVSYDHPVAAPGLVERRHVSRCRTARCGVGAHFIGMPKNRFEAIVKLLRQADAPKPNRDATVVRDRCRFLMVVKDVETARDFAAEIRWQLESHGAVVTDGGDNLTVDTGLPADPDNPASSRRYRKLQLDVLWRGRWYEIQFQTFDAHYSAKYALDEENHVIYKLTQGVRGVLRLFFPPDIYLAGERWDDPRLHGELHKRQIENLGWPLRRNGTRR